MSIEEIKKFIKENGSEAPEVIEQIGHGCVKYIDLDFDAELEDSGCWNGEYFEDEVAKYVFVDADDEVWVLAIDKTTYDSCSSYSSPEAEVFCYEPSRLKDYSEKNIDEIAFWLCLN